jgi:hypothetical protein
MRWIIFGVVSSWQVDALTQTPHERNPAAQPQIAQANQ